MGTLQVPCNGAFDNLEVLIVEARPEEDARLVIAKYMAGESNGTSGNYR